MPRSYTLKRRAKRQEETRKRIVDATVALHREVGPVRTTVSAIAERAGVQRLTVYRHFPDERALMLACSGQFMSENPPPDLAAWATIEDGRERLRAALNDVYSYYALTEEMMANLLRDRETSQLVEESMKVYFDYLGAARELLAQGIDAVDGNAETLAVAIGHALEFPTWRSLVRGQGLSNEDAASLMSHFVESAADVS